MRRLVIAATLFAAACSANESADNAIEVENLTAENVVAEGAERPKVECDVIGERVTQEECDDIRALSRDVKTGAAALNVPDPMTRGRRSQVTLVVDRRPLPEIRRIEAVPENVMDTVEVSDTSDVIEDVNAVASEDDFNAVASMEISEPDPSPSAAEDDAPAAETPNQVVGQLPGTDYSFPSQVGRYMKAGLAGQGFEIRLISPESPVQEIPAGGQGTWMWEVVPREGGEHTLTARTEAVAIVNGQPKPLGNGQTSKTVNVDVRNLDRAWDFLSALPDWFKLIAGVLGAATLVVVALVKLRKAARGDSK